MKKIKSIIYTPTFKSCYKSLKKKHYNMDKIEEVISLIVNREQEVLTNNYRDHQLHGDLRNFRELHIERDWLLTYRIIDDTLELFLVATGSHDDVFRRSRNTRF